MNQRKMSVVVIRWMAFLLMASTQLASAQVDAPSVDPYANETK